LTLLFYVTLNYFLAKLVTTRLNEVVKLLTDRSHNLHQWC